MTTLPVRLYILLAFFLHLGAPIDAMAYQANLVGYFEIPVTHMDRAVGFYETLFGLKLERTVIDGYPMALFPHHDGAGATGALAQGDVYVPGKAGPVLYFTVDDIKAVLSRAAGLGAVLLYPVKDIGTGRVAEIEDSEGNRLALYQPKC